jgi:hypothetical protein
MTKLQLALLLISLAYVLVKGILMFAIYWGSKMTEKKALKRQRIMHTLLTERRAVSREKYRKAYQLMKEEANNSAV